ncbi:MAG: gliding motility-associated C-terminal domain-containing protein [Saprospiraceae bacterium]|nr:gliding motility-associated C-terminal domain-containing protein [Saprospiraceae bacterium]
MTKGDVIRGVCFVLVASLFAFMSSYVLPAGSPVQFMPEDCFNAIDDDGDGLTDINDKDCICNIIDSISLVPNPSFELRTCCPSTRSQLDCAVGWIQASQATTDYLNTCGYYAKEDFEVPLPLPAGAGFIGLRDGRINPEGRIEPGWKEYAGSCLLAPMKANRTYSFEFYFGFSSSNISPSIDLSFFGTTDCINLPFGKNIDLFGCPSNDANWELLQSTFISAGTGKRWVKTKIEITPKKYIAAIAIGPSCEPSKNPFSTYYFMDDLQLLEVKETKPAIVPVGNPCAASFSIKVINDFGLNVQWYKNGVALVGEKSTSLYDLEEGNTYQAMVTDPATCYITEPYLFQGNTIRDTFEIVVCEGNELSFGNQIITTPGDYEAKFLTTASCDSIVTLSVNFSDKVVDTVDVKILKTEVYTIGGQQFNQEGIYDLVLKSSTGCDSLVVLDLDVIDVFFPNIFSLGGRGSNKTFQPSFDQSVIEQIFLTIYDRWGNVVFIGESWNPDLQKSQPVTGVFVYKAEIRLKDQSVKVLAGDVLLIR